MALFQHNNRTIPYRIALAPFHFDVVLLQGSAFEPRLWDPVLESLKDKPYAGGRILTCEWFQAGIGNHQLAEDFVKLMQTLALVSVRVVADGDAVAMVNEAQKILPRLFEKTLFFPAGAPKGETLKRAIFDLCEI